MTSSPVDTLPTLIATIGVEVASRVAVRQGTQVLTYGQLLERAAIFRADLVGRGIGRGSLVGVCVDRCTDLLALLVAVWQAGAAYVPMDPGAAAVERTLRIVEDAGCELVVVNPSSRDAVGWLNRPVVTLEELSTAAPLASGAPPTLPQDLAYVVYTSGSTGRPKGVMISHGSLAAYATWAARTYTASTALGSVVLSPIAFDLAVTSLFVPLLSGQTVHLADEGATMEDILGLLRGLPAMTFPKCTPTHLDVLSELSEEALPTPPAHVVVGGEAVYSAALRRWRAFCPGSAFHNEYGPTEVTVGSVVYRVPDGPTAIATGRIPIGRPLPGVEAHVLDEQLATVTAPGRGELFLGGPSVAVGYLGRPALTAQRFVAGPGPTRGESRLYRTGDAVDVLANGELAFAGRVDDQIKLKGHRIEPAEVEAALQKHGDVLGCAVVEAPGRFPTLAAFVVAASDADVSAAAIRSYLSRMLPSYMVPTIVRFVPALPLMGNGKTDRTSLREQLTRPLTGSAAEQNAARTD